MNLQTLVFDGARVETLKIDDVSLRVKAMHGPENRIPLRCLLRVHCHGEPRAGFLTLVELASRHIPVTFFDRRYQVLAQLYHPRPEPKPLAMWLEHCWEDALFRQQLDQWLANQQYALFGDLEIHQGTLVDRHAFLMLELSRFMSREPDKFSAFQEARAEAGHVLTAHLSEMLLVHGLPPGGSLREQLFRELYDMLDFWLDGQVHRWLGRFTAPVESEAATHRFYSYINKALCHRAGLLLQQLQGFVEAYALEQAS